MHTATSYLLVVILAGQIAAGAYLPQAESKPTADIYHRDGPKFTYAPTPSAWTTTTECSVVTITHYPYNPITKRAGENPINGLPVPTAVTDDVSRVTVTKTLTTVVSVNGLPAPTSLSNQTRTVIHRTSAEAPNPTAIPSMFGGSTISRNLSSTVIHRTTAVGPKPTAVPSMFGGSTFSRNLSATVIHRTTAEGPNPTAIPSMFQTKPFSNTSSTAIHRTSAEVPNPTAIPSAFPTKPFLTTFSTKIKSGFTITPLSPTTMNGHTAYTPVTSSASSKPSQVTSLPSFDEWWTHTTSKTTSSWDYPDPDKTTKMTSASSKATSTDSSKATSTSTGNDCAFPYPGCGS